LFRKKLIYLKKIVNSLQSSKNFKSMCTSFVNKSYGCLTAVSPVLLLVLMKSLNVLAKSTIETIRLRHFNNVERTLRYSVSRLTNLTANSVWIQ